MVQLFHVLGDGAFVSLSIVGGFININIMPYDIGSLLQGGIERPIIRTGEVGVAAVIIASACCMVRGCRHDISRSC